MEGCSKESSGFVKFAEQSTYMTARDVMAIHCIQNEFLLQRGKSCKQMDIRDFFRGGCRARNSAQPTSETSDE